MAYEPILSKRAISKMSQHNISKSEVMKAFSSSNKESAIAPPGATNGIYRSGKYEIVATYSKNHRGQQVIITCWKRKIY